MDEHDQKLGTLRDLVSRRGLDAVLLQRASSFAWATCGASDYVNLAASEGVAALLITKTDQFLLTNMPRWSVLTVGVQGRALQRPAILGIT